MKNFFTFILIFSGLFSQSATSEPTGFRAEDLYHLKNINDLALSPDGNKLAFVVQSIEQENNRYLSNIRIIDLQKNEIYQLTGNQTGSNFSPFWSPDSRYLGFVSNRSGSNQIWLIDISGGEAWTLTNVKNGVMQPTWSPNGQFIAFVSRSDEKSQISRFREKGEVLLDHQNREFSPHVKVISRLRYRRGTRFIGDEYNHIFIIPTKNDTPRQLTFGRFDDNHPQWSPDSKKILFNSNRQGNNDFDDNQDLCLVSVQGGPVEILTQNSGPDYAPVWSLDDSGIAYVSSSETNNFRKQREICTLTLPDKTKKILTLALDRTVTAPQWTPGGDRLYFLAYNEGNRHIYGTSTRKPNPQAICTGAREIIQFQIGPKARKIYFLATNPANPSDIFEFDIKRKKEKRLTFINENFFKTKSLSIPQPVQYSSNDGLSIHGWLMKPVGVTPPEKLPLIVQIHGGPFWCYGNRWELEFQILAAQGYGIFFCNPRTSIGYGQAFATQTPGKWGEADQTDILRGVAHVLKTGWFDSLRMGITGGSYGGFMTTTLISQTNKFKAAITQRSLSNLFSFYGTTDIQNLIESEFGAPIRNFESIMQHSPILWSNQIQTPLLIIHSEKDYRVPISQAEELFIHLKRQGAIVEFVRYPNEGHELSRSGQPRHRVDRLNRILEWFDRHLK